MRLVSEWAESWCWTLRMGTKAGWGPLRGSRTRRSGNDREGGPWPLATSIRAVVVRHLPFSDLGIEENAFILFGRDQVLAPDDRPAPTDEATKHEPREVSLTLTELGDPILEQIWNTEDLDSRRRRNRRRRFRRRKY